MALFFRYILMIFTIGILITHTAKSEEINSLNITKMIMPFAEKNVFKVPGYHTWGPQITHGEDGKYYMAYSRWAKEGGDWLLTSEIAIAVSDQADGPYTHEKVLLTGRGEGHWDELMAYNPKVKYFEGKYYLYYISSKNGPTRGHIRDSQRIGVAIADNILGPYVRSDTPLIEPKKPIFNITVNPGVTQMPDGRYLMILKGDITPKLPTDPMPQRIQGLAIANSPTGPFKILPDVAIKDIDTEDATIWYDEKRELYFAVFHAHTHIGLIQSTDGINWKRAGNFIITENKLLREDGSYLSKELEEPLQRPNIYIENGEPRALALAIPEPDDWHIIIVPLQND
ncbi:MAG: hypothetical protein HOH19_08275 [Kordiimonadaceae bacterium]|jgi:hypothetical protein|nr:hypothetical protein [Kordiimonadaceae bacterium]MBT6032558.1 hypothetical protein [Kordiimonadaceae bacterium]